MTTETIGFIGLGNMGGRMTKCIIRGGRDVLGFDANPSAIDGSGASGAASVAELTRASDFILLSLPDSHVVESVVFDDGGVLENIDSGKVVIDLSTAAPESTRRVHELLAQKGAAYLDAGISGGAAAADVGKLTLMVGGETEALDRVRSV
ncbi:MAG: NAD(P)-binding domain-containing protein, partial [Acidimicrobiales bacterium]